MTDSVQPCQGGDHDRDPQVITTRETVFSALGVEAIQPTGWGVEMAVIPNPFAVQFVEDLRLLFEAGAMLGSSGRQPAIR